MAIIVSILGVLIWLIGFIGLARPDLLTTMIGNWQGPSRFYTAVSVRLVLGVVLIAVAPQCKLQTLVFVFGVISIAAAVTIAILGRKRLDAFIVWWLSCSKSLVRISAVFAMTVGALLMYAGGL